MIYTIIRGVIEGSPRKLTIASLILIAFGTCPGVALFERYGFLNPLSILCYGIALLVFLLALFKYLAWRRSGLTQSLPNQAVLLQLDHMFLETRTTRARPVLGVRETTTHLATQPMVLPPPSLSSQDVLVRCTTCQQEVVLRVDSLQERKRRRLRTVLISGTSVAVAVTLGILSSNVAQTAGWVSWARIGFLILLFCGTVGIGSLFTYVGARSVNVPRGHRVRLPTRVDLVSFRRATSQTQ